MAKEDEEVQPGVGREDDDADDDILFWELEAKKSSDWTKFVVSFVFVFKKERFESSSSSCPFFCKMEEWQKEESESIVSN